MERFVDGVEPSRLFDYEPIGLLAYLWFMGHRVRTLPIQIEFVVGPPSRIGLSIPSEYITIPFSAFQTWEGSVLANLARKQWQRPSKKWAIALARINALSCLPSRFQE